MNKKAVAKEWLIFVTSFVIGTVVIPSILYLFTDISGNRPSFETFYDRYPMRDWYTLMFAPYIAIQGVRSIIWGIKSARGGKQ